MASQPNSPNHLLASLSAGDFEAIRPHLKAFDLVQEEVLISTGDAIHRVFFPHSGIISLVVDLAGGETIETAMIGRDSIVGASSVLNGAISLNKAVVQLSGHGSVLDAVRFRQFAEASPALRSTLIRHEQILYAQAQQSAACNATHTVEARLARWLLRARDLGGSDTLELTQEFLAQMLGVRRTSVTLVASTLQQAGLIRYKRGRIQITDMEGLQDAACECYGTVKRHYDRLLESD